MFYQRILEINASQPVELLLQFSVDRLMIDILSEGVNAVRDVANVTNLRIWSVL